MIFYQMDDNVFSKYKKIDGFGSIPMVISYAMARLGYGYASKRNGWERSLQDAIQQIATEALPQPNIAPNVLVLKEKGYDTNNQGDRSDLWVNIVHWVPMNSIVPVQFQGDSIVRGIISPEYIIEMKCMKCNESVDDFINRALSDVMKFGFFMQLDVTPWKYKPCSTYGSEQIVMDLQPQYVNSVCYQPVVGIIMLFISYKKIDNEMLVVSEKSQESLFIATERLVNNIQNINVSFNMENCGYKNIGVFIQDFDFIPFWSTRCFNNGLIGTSNELPAGIRCIYLYTMNGSVTDTNNPENKTLLPRVVGFL